MRDILQSRYLRSNVAHKQLARTSLIDFSNNSEHAILNDIDHDLAPENLKNLFTRLVSFL